MRILLDVGIAALAYALGSLPSGFIYGRLLKRVDVRKIGSANIGGMNVFRNVGVLPGALTALTDVGKGMAAAYIGKAWGAWPYLGLVCAVAVVLGHNYMLFLGFRGGKGLGAALGAFLVLSPPAIPLVLAMVVVASLLLRDTNTASALGVCFLPLVLWLLKRDAMWALLGGAAALVIVLRHLPDIRAYLRGRRQIV